MTKLPASTAVIVSLLAPSAAVAAEKTITLAVKNMYMRRLPWNDQGEPPSRAWCNQRHGVGRG
jgi:hypothetical protein